MENESMWTVERVKNPKPKLSLVEKMVVTRGTKKDWDQLEALHYKQAGSLPAGAHHYVLKLGEELIGVLVMSCPKLLLKERHKLFPSIKPSKHDTKLTNVTRMKWLNANMQVVSRVVVDTMYRGAGLAYRFTNLCCRMEGKRFIEIQSSMSKYNLFAQKAGFQFVKPMHSNKFDHGIVFFRRHFKSEPADLEAIVEEWLNMSPHEKDFVEAEAREFYYKHSALEKTGTCGSSGMGERRVASKPFREIISNIQQMTLASPLYGVYVNPDLGRELPDTIPLSAFDNQKPNEPLRI